jgi:uncharacterized membrane protein YcaP (DUF421 family)
MFQLEHSWWEFPARAALVYVALLLLMRLSGKRTVGQFTPFDLVVVMLISEGVSESLHGSDTSVPAGLLIAATVILLDVIAAWASSHSRKADKLLQGRAVLIGKDGRILDDVLRRERVAIEDVFRALRTEDCEIADMRRAYLEADGEISILKKKTS